MSSVMSFMPVVWIVWAAVITFLLVLLVYRSNLTRYEEDQIFLGDGFKEERSAQAAIAEKVSKVEPMKRLALGLVGVMTLFVIGYYVLDIVKQFK